jgi:hypothetical protein
LSSAHHSAVGRTVHQVAVHLFIRSRFICSSGRRATVHQTAEQLFIRPPCYCSSGWRATVFQTCVQLLIQSGTLLLFRPACSCLSGRLLTAGTANGSLNLLLAYIWMNRNSLFSYYRTVGSKLAQDGNSSYRHYRRIGSRGTIKKWEVEDCHQVDSKSVLQCN